ncbi:MAG: hypothetical protein PV358_08070 [Acidimicrobiales bacterium]|nr:hypothetical protein [Acidimicrobiales bacterium]
MFSIAVSATGVVIPSGRLLARDGAVLGKDVLLANLGLHASARSTWPASLRPRSPGTTRTPTGSAG